ncbi:MAG TPA: hypothetical protein PKW88_03735 [Plasticicumulans sp.]|nr:hypothetical protein [Plasticicumulans sp.]
MDSDLDTLTRLRAVVDASGWLDDPAAMAPYLAESRGRLHGEALAVARPRTTAEVAALVAICHEQRIGVVPQGG